MAKYIVWTNYKSTRPTSGIGELSDTHTLVVKMP